MLRKTGEHSTTQPEAQEFETINTGDTRTDAATAFNEFQLRAQGNPDVVYSEAEIPNFPGFEEILGKIIKKTPENHAKVIAIRPMPGSNATERHIFILKRVKKGVVIDTFFDIEHRDGSVQGVEAVQTVDFKNLHLQRIIGLNSEGLPGVIHNDGVQRQRRPTHKLDAWHKDLGSMVEAVDRPVLEVVKTNTAEFDAVVTPDPRFVDRLAGAALGFRHPEKLKLVA